eukprot:358727-Chlamydomonas_euryale.AAC.10
MRPHICCSLPANAPRPAARTYRCGGAGTALWRISTGMRAGGEGSRYLGWPAGQSHWPMEGWMAWPPTSTTTHLLVVNNQVEGVNASTPGSTKMNNDEAAARADGKSSAVGAAAAGWGPMTRSGEAVAAVLPVQLAEERAWSSSRRRQLSVELRCRGLGSDTARATAGQTPRS